MYNAIWCLFHGTCIEYADPPLDSRTWKLTLVTRNRAKKMIWTIRPILIIFSPFAAVLTWTSIPAPSWMNCEFMFAVVPDWGWNGARHTSGLDEEAYHVAENKYLGQPWSADDRVFFSAGDNHDPTECHIDSRSIKRRRYHNENGLYCERTDGVVRVLIWGDSALNMSVDGSLSAIEGIRTAAYPAISTWINVSNLIQCSWWMVHLQMPPLMNGMKNHVRLRYICHECSIHAMPKITAKITAAGMEGM